jgi:hypothetical protein
MKEIILVFAVGGLAMLISWLGMAIQTHEQAYQIESNEEFNAALIEQAKMQRAEDASH